MSCITWCKFACDIRFNKLYKNILRKYFEVQITWYVEIVEIEPEIYKVL